MTKKEFKKKLLKKMSALAKLRANEYVCSKFNRGDLIVNWEEGFRECMYILLPMLEEAEEVISYYAGDHTITAKKYLDKEKEIKNEQ